MGIHGGKGKMRKASLRRYGWGLTAALAALALASGPAVVVARADEDAKKVKKVKDHTAGPLETDEPVASAEEAKGRPAAVKGMQAYVDPADGKLRQPTREEAQALAAELAKLTSRSTEGLEAVLSEDGTLSMDLEGRFLSVAIATVGPDGSVGFACVNGEPAAPLAAASDAATKPAPKPAKAKEALDEY
jgi:hypothetical protein